MRIYDITKELLSSEVYAGDTKPTITKVCDIQKGDSCNLSDLTMCVHNGTHVDAPYHFIEEGMDISEIPLDIMIGECIVIEWDKKWNENQVNHALQKVLQQYGHVERLLFKGIDVSISLPIAKILTTYPIRLIGVEKNTVGNEEIDGDIESVHKHLLGNKILIIENLDLSQVTEGNYMLYAQPLKIKGADGAPCRAILTEIGFEQR